jgi:Zn-dependent metalloprotease
MGKKRRPINCIVPPHILEKLLGSPNDDVRKAALRTLTTSARIRGEREILGPIRSAFAVNAVGQLRRSIHDAQHHRLPPSSMPGLLVRSEGQAAVSDKSVNRAYDGLGKTYDFFKTVLGRNSIDGHGMRLTATVHFGQRFNNAFWNGAQMVFGDGDGIIFVDFTKSVDVIAHELTHGVTESMAGLEYHNQSGALNESFSDVFGSLVKQYSNNPKQNVNQADWLIGNDILAPGVRGVALRSMKDPGTAYRDDPNLGSDPQPKHMSDFVVLSDDEEGDFGGVHINSGIPNHAFYLVARSLGGFAWEQAGVIWYEALKQLFPLASFQDCADVTAQVAAAKFGTGSRQHDAVIDAWDQVGIRVTAPQPVATPAERVEAAGSNGSHAITLKEKLEAISEQLRVTASELSVS